MPSIQRIWSGPGWFGTRRSMVQIHSPRPLLFKANNLQQRKVPTTSWLGAKRSVVPMSSPNDLHFPLQIGVKWRDAATPFSSFCSPRSPNRTSFGMDRLKTEAYFLAAFLTVWDVFEKSFRSSCCRSHGPSRVAKRQCSQPEEISHRSEHSVSTRRSSTDPRSQSF